MGGAKGSGVLSPSHLPRCHPQRDPRGRTAAIPGDLPGLSSAPGVVGAAGALCATALHCSVTGEDFAPQGPTAASTAAWGVGGDGQSPHRETAGCQAGGPAGGTGWSHCPGSTTGPPEHRARVVGRHRLLQLHRHLLCSSCPHGAPPIPSESPQQPHPSIHRSLIISSCPQDSPKTFSVLLTPSVELSAPHIPQHSPPVHPRCPPPPAALSATPPYRHPAPSLEPRPRGRGAADLARPLAAACPPARGPPSATL